MLLLHILLIVLLFGFIGNGWKDGFIHALGRLVGAIIGFFLARSWSVPVASVLSLVFPAGWARFVAFIVIFFIVSRLIGWLFNFLQGIVNILAFIPFLKTINQLLGAIVGALEGFVAIGAMIWIIVHFNLIPSVAALLVHSSVARVFEKMFSFFLSVLPNVLHG